MVVVVEEGEGGLIKYHNFFFQNILHGSQKHSLKTNKDLKSLPLPIYSIHHPTRLTEYKKI